jgi:hypothetical protein
MDEWQVGGMGFEMIDEEGTENSKAPVLTGAF